MLTDNQQNELAYFKAQEERRRHMMSSISTIHSDISTIMNQLQQHKSVSSVKSTTEAQEYLYKPAKNEGCLTVPHT